MTMNGQSVTRMMPRDGEQGGHREDLRWEYQTKRDERLFQIQALRCRGEALRAARHAYTPGWRGRRCIDIVGAPHDYYGAEGGRLILAERAR